MNILKDYRHLPKFHELAMNDAPLALEVCEELENWINQNYISKEEHKKSDEVNCDMAEELKKIALEKQKEEILGLEGLKEEEVGEPVDIYQDTNRALDNIVNQTRNQLRNEIKQQIIDYKFKDFKQVSNPLEHYDSGCKCDDCQKVNNSEL